MAMSSVNISLSGQRLDVAERTYPIDAAADQVVALETPVFLGQRPRSRVLSTTLRVSVPVALLLIWWLGTTTQWISPQILASPSKVWGAFREIQGSGDLWTFMAASLGRVAKGMALGLPIGLALGILAGLSATGEEVIDPTMQMFRAVPFLALVPLFLAWFGIGENFKVILIGAATALPIYAYAYLGVRNVDRKVIEAARGFGLKRTRLVTEVILPAALPSILMALRVCLALAMTALIVAEGIGTEKGIGYLVLEARQYARTDYTMLCVVMYAVIGLGIDLIIRLIERVSMPWRVHSVVR
jgi:sulfonate transport system permease protein